jgi:CHRD domain
MRKLLQSTCLMAVALLASALTVAAQPAQGKALAAVKLTGDAEVPGPGDSKGSGTVTVTVNPEKGEVCYDLTVANLQEATAAHIHEGAVGKEGPVKVGLEAPKTGAAKGCKSAEPAVIQAFMEHPANYYVNVHTTDFPKGAVRGQLAK